MALKGGAVQPGEKSVTSPGNLGGPQLRAMTLSAELFAAAAMAEVSKDLMEITVPELKRRSWLRWASPPQGPRRGCAAACTLRLYVGTSTNDEDE